MSELIKMFHSLSIIVSQFSSLSEIQNNVQQYVLLSVCDYGLHLRSHILHREASPSVSTPVQQSRIAPSRTEQYPSEFFSAIGEKRKSHSHDPLYTGWVAMSINLSVNLAISFSDTRRSKTSMNVPKLFTFPFSGSYVVGWLPGTIVYTLACEDCLLKLDWFTPNEKFIIFNIVNCLIILKTLVNPIIYAARMHEIKVNGRIPN